MAKATPDAPATYFRLSDETWAMIVEEYANGATAKQLGAKWKVAPNSVYRHVGAARMTKRDCGDQRARAHAKAVSLAAAARDAKLGPRPDTVEPALTTLFAPLRPGETDEAADPAALMRLATRASGRAMTGRLWAEAKALAGLAESYARLAEKAPRKYSAPEDFDIDTVDIEVLMQMLGNRDRVEARFALEPGEDPKFPSERVFFWLPVEEKRAVIHHRLDQMVAERDEANRRRAEGDAGGYWDGCGGGRGDGYRGAL